MTRRTPSGHSAAEMATRKPIKQAISIVKRMVRRETATGRQRNRELDSKRVSAHLPPIAISHHLVAGPHAVPPPRGTPGRRSRPPNDYAAVAVVGKSCAPTVPSLQNARMQKLLTRALLCFASVTAFSAPTPAGRPQVLSGARDGFADAAADSSGDGGGGGGGAEYELRRVIDTRILYAVRVS